MSVLQIPAKRTRTSASPVGVATSSRSRSCRFSSQSARIVERRPARRRSMIDAMAGRRNSYVLYIVRHGLAQTQGEDRSLTDTGHDEIEVIARWAAGAGVEPRQIRHSGKRRAEQTASILP